MKGPHYIKRSGKVGRVEWLEVAKISDGRVQLIQYERAALGGWKERVRWDQHAEGWVGMDADAILAFKKNSGLDMEPVADPTVVAAFERNWANPPVAQ